MAPPTARSLTVPWTASLPMSPPGKKSGRTTNESVVIAIRGERRSIVARQTDGRLVLERGQHVVAVSRQEQPRDQLRRSEAAAAVAQRDPVVRRNG